MHRLVPVLLLGMLCACGMAIQAQIDRFEPSALAYQRAIRWSDFPTAYGVAIEPGTAAAPDFDHLKDIRVTSYEVGAQQVDAEGRMCVQVVEIRYVNTSRMAERVFVDKQTWKYSEKDQRWYLKSAFPQFE
jgi:hypothetical protein